MPNERDTNEDLQSSEKNNQTMSGVERFHGPDYLTGFTPDRDAMERLIEIESHTAHRLVEYVRGGWPGILSSEDFLGPLAQANGDIVLRVIDTPGSAWIYWRGNPCGNHYYGRIHALPHYQDHKVVSRRESTPDRLADYFKNSGSVIPIHVDNVPEPIWEFIQNSRVYKNKNGDQRCQATDNE